MTRNRKRKPVRYVILALSALVAFLFTFCRSAAPEAAYPFERGWRFFRQSVGSRIIGAFRGASASAENLALRRQVAALSLLQGECERLENENSRLRAALEYRKNLRGEWLAASVLSAGGGAASVHRVIRVDRGESDGVRKGAVVVTPAGLVGRVGATTAHTAVIRPLTDPSLQVACELRSGGSEEIVRGILAGGDDERLLLKHMILPDGFSPPGRSSVYTSGLGGIFPAGITVGFFTEMLSEETPVRSATIEPAVDFSTLEDVFICRER